MADARDKGDSSKRAALSLAGYFVSPMLRDGRPAQRMACVARTRLRRWMDGWRGLCITIPPPAMLHLRPFACLCSKASRSSRSICDATRIAHAQRKHPGRHLPNADAMCSTLIPATIPPSMFPSGDTPMFETLSHLARLATSCPFVVVLCLITSRVHIRTDADTVPCLN